MSARTGVGAGRTHLGLRGRRHRRDGGVQLAVLGGIGRCARLPVHAAGRARLGTDGCRHPVAVRAARSGGAAQRDRGDVLVLAGHRGLPRLGHRSRRAGPIGPGIRRGLGLAPARWTVRIRPHRRDVPPGTGRSLPLAPLAVGRPRHRHRTHPLQRGAGQRGSDQHRHRGDGRRRGARPGLQPGLLHDRRWAGRRAGLHVDPAAPQHGGGTSAGPADRAGGGGAGRRPREPADRAVPERW